MEALQGGQPAGQRPPAAPGSPASGVTAARPSPTAIGSRAPDPATAAPTSRPTITPAPNETAVAGGPQPPADLPPLVLSMPSERSNEQRWRAQQQDRVVFEALRPYVTGGTDLWWYDPLNQQHVRLGRISGDFVAQATFVLPDEGRPALEVPYHVNVGYGLTALSPALLERIRAAGYGDWIETYVFETHDVQPR